MIIRWQLRLPERFLTAWLGVSPWMSEEPARPAPSTSLEPAATRVTVLVAPPSMPCSSRRMPTRGLPQQTLGQVLAVRRGYLVVQCLGHADLGQPGMAREGADPIATRARLGCIGRDVLVLRELLDEPGQVPGQGRGPLWMEPFLVDQVVWSSPTIRALIVERSSPASSASSMGKS